MSNPTMLMELARYVNRRAVRMLKCATGVESCSHSRQFKQLAEAYFIDRARLVAAARDATGKPKRWKFVIELNGVEQEGWFDGFDPLSVGAMYEESCDDIGVDPGDYRVVKRRDRL